VGRREGRRCGQWRSVGAIVGGLFVIGSPGDARRAKLDARRVSDLRAIATGIDAHWNRRDSLPADVAELKEILPHGVSITDPETNKPYTYRVFDDGVYELCAVFEMDHRTFPGSISKLWQAQ